METVRKITARTVGISKGSKAIGESFVVLGRVARAIPDQGDYGDYIRLKGQFRAINEHTGEEFAAPVFISPGGLIENEIATALNSAAEDGGTASVDFGARFKMVEADNATGCEWRAEMLTKPAADDPVERLASSLRDKVPALAKPDAEKAQPASEGEGRRAEAQSKKKAAASK